MRFLAVLFLTVSLAQAGSFYTSQGARLLIGQKDFTAQSPQFSQQILGAAGAVAYANNMLIVGDSNRLGIGPVNNRVLIYKNLSSQLPGPYDTFPKSPQSTKCQACVGLADVVLGQNDFTTGAPGLSRSAFWQPNGVTTDGQNIAVADTANNRVLLWRSIPNANNAPADIVLGQPDFSTRLVNNGGGDSQGRAPTASSMRGPQGVWLRDGKLFVADTQNSRVLIWNSIPTRNNQPADVVVGKPSFTTWISPDILSTPVTAKADNLLDPVSVTTDGQRMYVSDLGHNRVLIYEPIPTSNAPSARAVIGQRDFESAAANDSTKLCSPVGKNDAGEDLFPQLCESTLSFPRFALSDGRRLFIADGGNDRVLIFDRIPTANAAKADVVLGQISAELNQTSDNPDNPDIDRKASAAATRTPVSLAWDGTNLYVSDPSNRRILVFSEGDIPLAYTSVRNSASRDVRAVGSISFSGTVAKDKEVTVTISKGDVKNQYTYKTAERDTLQLIVINLADAINKGRGDPLVIAAPNLNPPLLLLTAKEVGPGGNNVEIASQAPESTIIIVTSGAKLSGGGDPTRIAPGTFISILGESLTDQTASADMSRDELPYELGNVQVYLNGKPAPLLYVSPNQINAQFHWEFYGTDSVSAYVRTRRKDGLVTVSSPVAISVITEYPGIFAGEGVDPRPAIALHYSSAATGTILVDGSIRAGDTARVNIEDRVYTYTVQTGDTLETVRDQLIALINDDPRVFAFPAGQFTRIRLKAREPGPAGNFITFSAKSEPENLAQIILTPTNTSLCCANQEGALITADNPAIPGETVVIYATGLGLVDPAEATEALKTGLRYEGPVLNKPKEFVSSLVGGRTANVLYTGVKPGTFGLYEVHLELNAGLETSDAAQMTIAQSFQVSNIATIPVVNPKPPE